VDAATLIAAIIDDPDAIDRWLVYADWLLDRGDPRGELISLEIAIEAGTADAEAQSRVNRLRRDEDALLSPRLAAQAHYWRFDLWRGFIRGATLMGASDDRPGPEAVAALCADPHVALLERITIVAPANVIAPLFTSQHRRLRYMGASAIDGVRFAASMPVLDWLVLHSDTCSIAKLVHPELRNLTARRNTCPALATGAFALPALTSLTCGVEPGHPNVEDRRSILHRPPPRLASLSLEIEPTIGAEGFGPPPTAFILRVAALPAVRAASSLALEHVGVAALDALARDASPLTHLERLRLDLWDFFEDGDPDEVAVLRSRIEAAFPRTELDLRWGRLLPPRPPAERDPLPPIDEQSRLPDGRIDPFGGFIRGRDG